MYKAKAYSVASATSSLASTTIVRRDPLNTTYRSKSSSAVSAIRSHQVRNEWKGSAHCLSCVPGMRSSAVSPKSAPESRSSSPQLRPRSAAWSTPTGLSRCQRALAVLPEHNPHVQLPDKHLGGVTYGGYSESVVVDERFVLRILPTSISPEPRLPLRPASQPTRPCSLGVTKGKKVAWSVSADWATWV